MKSGQILIVSCEIPQASDRYVRALRSRYLKREGRDAREVSTPPAAGGGEGLSIDTGTRSCVFWSVGCDLRSNTSTFSSAENLTPSSLQLDAKPHGPCIRPTPAPQKTAQEGSHVAESRSSPTSATTANEALSFKRTCARVSVSDNCRINLISLNVR